jgi:alpha-amylase/alpha-mannosidase (GH57 family)
MKKLKVAILWHFHQPYYLKNDEFILPWTRLHGVKDYWDLPEYFYSYPNIKQTINIAPSMWAQIEKYVKREACDSIQILTLKNPEDLSETDKKELFRMFVLCNEQNMIDSYPRYKFLKDKIKGSDNPELSRQEIIDLQVWYNLTWIGAYSRKRVAVERLFAKAENFNDSDRNLVLEMHLDILSSISNQLKTLKNIGALELSCSPFYHPILPLLYDTDSLKEAMPNAQTPEVKFSRPDDAKLQIDMATEYFSGIFGEKPSGMWPSEGSISNPILEMLADSGIKWAASDELILKESMGASYKNYYKFFPINYTRNNKSIKLFFRDHELSDAIGFVYSNWNAQDAAKDFLNRLSRIRDYLINGLGESSLDYATVPVILDGENCWEYYKNNGYEFLNALFNELSNSEIIETIRFGDAPNTSNNFVPVLNSIRAGSWINANFKIWAGHIDHVKAWSYLATARNEVENRREIIGEDKYKQAMDIMLVAEGSDWFWWYGDTHWAENKFDFDDLFRFYLQKIYEIIELEIPIGLLEPINQCRQKAQILKRSESTISPDIYTFDVAAWAKAGKYDVAAVASTMSRVGEIVSSIYFGKNDDAIFLRIEFDKELCADDIVTVQFVSDNKCVISKSSIAFNRIDGAAYSVENNIYQLSIKYGNIADYKLFAVVHKAATKEFVYPASGSIEL